MLNILVTGSTGQVGQSLQAIAKDYRYHFIFSGRKNFNLCDKNQVEAFVLKHQVNVIINCAAYTAVDKAESEESLAEAVNHLAIANLAELAKKHSIQLIHLSTDYVFDGLQSFPYSELDTVNPQGIYGKTKLAGEKALIKINPQNSIIMRTSWVYSAFGNNFVKTMLRLGKEKKSLNVVADQVGSPTYAMDIARAILAIVPQLNTQRVEIYHFSNEGVASWYDFATEIMALAQMNCFVKPISTAEYPTPAKRPFYSVLNKAKIRQSYGLEIPYWKDSLKKCLEELNKNDE